MKKWIYTTGICFALAIAGCASKEPVADLINNAQSAMDDAGNAKDCATQTFALAQQALKEAQEAVEAGDEETARQKARLAQSLAKQAKEEAEQNAEDCERQRNAANDLAEKLAPFQDDFANATDLALDDTFKVIYFDFDESFISTDAMADLQANVNTLKTRPELNVILAAHTDERGTTEYNLALSQKRGDAVKEHAQSLGIDAARMTVVPYGKEKPASSGTRDQDYALNRRVEFIPR